MRCTFALLINDFDPQVNVARNGNRTLSTATTPLQTSFSFDSCFGRKGDAFCGVSIERLAWESGAVASFAGQRSRRGIRGSQIYEIYVYMIT